MTEQFEIELKEMFEKIKPKVIFDSTNYLNILQIGFKLIEKLQKKNKEYKKISLEGKETISRNISLHIARVALEHNIIDNETLVIIETFINHKDSIVNFIEMFYSKTCFCIRRKKKIL